MSTCFFSIVLPTKDRFFLLEPLIKSILDQDFKDFELIISDNSDSEKTQQLLTKFRDKRIINVRTGGLKMADNWDQSIKLASGKYMLLFSDKMLLKKGALEYLHNYLKENPVECVTWNIDIFCDKEKVFFKGSQLSHKSKISSDDLIKKIILSDYHSYDSAPFHCNSCISVKLLNQIRSKFGRISNQLNPDYTLSYQVVLNVQNIYRLEKSLVILRQKDIQEGYGNGFSFIKKTQASDQFIQDNKDWFTKNNQTKEIPIHGNKFEIDIIMKDLYEILGKNNIDPNFYAGHEKRLISYYCRTFDEIYWRIGMGVNMSHEKENWKKALLKEKICVQNDVNHYLNTKKLAIITSLAKKIIKSFPLISQVVHFFKTFLKTNKGFKFSSLDQLLEDQRI